MQYGTLIEFLTCEGRAKNILNNKDDIKSNNTVKFRQIVSFIIVTMLLTCLFSGCINTQNNLLNGFWMADKQNQYDYDDFDMDFGMDYGFVFKEDGQLLTTSHLLWSYTITENDQIEINRVNGDGIQELMFSGFYNEDDDTLELNFTDAAIDYYDLISLDNSLIILTHYEDSEENTLLKSLIFDIWFSCDDIISTVSVPAVQDGFEIYSDYNEFRISLAESYENLELYEFNYNMDEFDEFNVKQLHYYSDDNEWRYTPYCYTVLDDNQITLKAAEGGVSVTYQYNDSELVNSDTNQIIYRATNFVD